MESSVAHQSKALSPGQSKNAASATCRKKRSAMGCVLKNVEMGLRVVIGS